MTHPHHPDTPATGAGASDRVAAPSSAATRAVAGRQLAAGFERRAPADRRAGLRAVQDDAAFAAFLDALTPAGRRCLTPWAVFRGVRLRERPARLRAYTALAERLTASVPDARPLAHALARDPGNSRPHDWLHGLAAIHQGVWWHTDAWEPALLAGVQAGAVRADRPLGRALLQWVADHAGATPHTGGFFLAIRVIRAFPAVPEPMRRRLVTALIADGDRVAVREAMHLCEAAGATTGTRVAACHALAAHGHHAALEQLVRGVVSGWRTDPALRRALVDAVTAHPAHETVLAVVDRVAARTTPAEWRRLLHVAAGHAPGAALRLLTRDASPARVAGLRTAEWAALLASPDAALREWALLHLGDRRRRASFGARSASR